MNIYSLIPITQNQQENFQPTRLYIKELAGKKYFGKTSKEDILNYTGSGTVWNKRIKKYGKENIITIWVSDWFNCPYHIQQFALTFSELNQIVESNNWDNLKPEDGLSGGTPKGTGKGRPSKTKGIPISKEHIKNISNSLKGKTNRAIPILIDGVVYSSIVAAARQLNVVEMTIYNWIKSGRAVKLNNLS